MKVALLHYHLKPGGVTTVLRQQAEALAGAAEVLVLTGEPPDMAFPAPVIHVPGIGYDRVNPDLSPAAVASGVREAIHSHWPEGCDLVHVHNPTLAKNRRFLKILARLREEGERLFLQIHDFAEDGRPDVYFQTEEYPADCHYGVINSRDRRILRQAGLTLAGVHVLPNMVTPLPSAPRPVEMADYVLYPVRALRRKNIGEAVLLSLFLEAPASLTVTLPPHSPADLASLADWKHFVKAHGLTVRFDAGLAHDFAGLVHGAGWLVTTSITEGFGFGFLEPWTAQKPLWGRDLPDITRDFRDKGIRLDHLYPRLQVPLAWIGARPFYETWAGWRTNTLRRFRVPFTADDLAADFRRITPRGTVDLGLMTEGMQRAVIRRIRDTAAAGDALVRLNPFLERPGHLPDVASLADHNRDCIRRHYSRDAYRAALLATYRRVMGPLPAQRIDKGRLLAFFLDPQRFSLLKWADYPGGSAPRA